MYNYDKHPSDRDPWNFILGMMAAIAVASAFMMLVFLSGCTLKKHMNIPEEPTIWAVSEIKLLEYKWSEGFVFYRIIPINPGGVNARTVWIMEYPGAFQVGDRVNFQIIQGDQVKKVSSKQYSH